MNQHRTPRVALLAAVAVATALASGLAGCNRPGDDRTAGQKLDDTIADAKQAGDDAKADASQAAQAAAKVVGDATIVTRINAALVADDKLKALKIDVSSAAGRVKLTGTAPDADSRQRATALAASVNGVVSVDNEMTVTRNG